MRSSATFQERLDKAIFISEMGNVDGRRAGRTFYPWVVEAVSVYKWDIPTDHSDHVPPGAASIDSLDVRPRTWQWPTIASI